MTIDRLTLLTRFLHHPPREGNRQAADNAAVSADGGEKRKPLQNGPFVGSPNFVPKLPTDGEDTVPFSVVVVMIWLYISAKYPR